MREPLSEAQGGHLLRLARAAIAFALGDTEAGEGAWYAPPPDDPWLLEPAATFITLTRYGELHGCIGSIEARRALHEDVKHNAVAAALYDPRALPLRLRDIDDLHVEVSLLSPLEAMSWTGERDALAQLRPYVDGVVFAFGVQRATFLPQVWDSLPTPDEFMAHLKQKAGLPADFWAPGVKLSRYSLQKWSDEASTTVEAREIASLH